MGSILHGFSFEFSEAEELLFFFTEEELVQSQNYNLWLIPPTLAPPKEAHERERSRKTLVHMHMNFTIFIHIFRNF